MGILSKASVKHNLHRTWYLAPPAMSSDLDCERLMRDEGADMNEIEQGRTAINERVGRYLKAHPNRTYEQVAVTLGVSRWRVLMVAASLGITRKTGPKARRASMTRSDKPQGDAA